MGRLAAIAIALGRCGHVGFADDHDAIAGDAAPLVWTIEPTGTVEALWAVWGSGANDVYVAGSNGDMLHSTGDGTWTIEATGGGTLYDVRGLSASDVYAVGNTNGVAYSVLHSTGDGTWTPQTNPFTAPLNGVWPFSAGDLYVSGYDGELAHSTGGGWVEDTGLATNMFQLWASSPTDIYAIGYGGTILHDDGTGWTAQASGTTQNLLGIWGSSATDVYVVGYAGTILHSAGDGTWTPVASGIARDLWGVWGSGPGDLYVCGDGPLFLHGAGDGVWTEHDSGSTGTQLEDFWGSGPRDLYVVGDNGFIAHAD